MIHASILFAALLLVPILCYGIWKHSSQYKSSLARRALRSLILAVMLAPVPTYPLGIGEFFVPSIIALLSYVVRPSDLQEVYAIIVLKRQLGWILVTWAIIFGVSAIFVRARALRNQKQR